MNKKNRNKGFSLLELIVAISILAVFASFLAPSLVHMVQEARMDKDMTKFESMCAAFKTALGEPEVKKEAQTISGGGDITVICHIADDGIIKFEDSEVIGTSSTTMKNTVLWLNIHQTIGITYDVDSEQLHNQYVVFTLTPKTTATTASCEYEILEKHP